MQSTLQIPLTQQDWQEIGRKFQKRWNFPRCAGALDGKHIRIQCPPCTGSEFYNCKKFFSIVLFAITSHTCPLELMDAPVMLVFGPHVC